MNPVSSVDAKLAARVVRAASELNYTPNTQAQRWSPAEAAFIGRFISEGT
jgi:DNA-binding LacI/PurR family transcriptional regulator